METNIRKKVVGNLNKCYCLAPLFYENQWHILVGAEKHDPCLLLDQWGNEVDKIWDEPGGVMSMVQIPNSDGSFLASQKFYSPNDSQEAKIVRVTPVSKGNWQVETVLELPFVHRFDILERNGYHYLIACTLKSSHKEKDDWTSAGKVYGGLLDLTEIPLKLTELFSPITKNHGYSRISGEESCLVTGEEGVFRFTPPASPDQPWEQELLLDVPTSDGVLYDFDGDGSQELVVISPFHGETCRIYKKKDGKFQKIYQMSEPLPFLHGIYGGEMCGTPTGSGILIGNREGERKLLSIHYEKGKYVEKVWDTQAGTANILRFVGEEGEVFVATNREINEITFYYTQESGN